MHYRKDNTSAPIRLPVWAAAASMVRWFSSRRLRHGPRASRRRSIKERRFALTWQPSSPFHPPARITNLKPYGQPSGRNNWRFGFGNIAGFEAANRPVGSVSGIYLLVELSLLVGAAGGGAFVVTASDAATKGAAAGVAGAGAGTGSGAFGGVAGGAGVGAVLAESFASLVVAAPY
jgi:hypothetical protein